MIPKLVFLLVALTITPVLLADAYAQVSSGGSPFERNFGDVKFLDAYFGTIDEKIEVDSGDKNVPFTVIFANVGTQDITGIRGQLSLPFGFSASDGPRSLIFADSDSNSLAGETFSLTFFVSVGDQVSIGQYHASVKVDYSRLREAGQRNVFFDFEFKVTGDSIINMRALEPFLTSLQKNHVIIEIANDGTAPISGVDIVATNTQTALSSTQNSITNVERVVVLDTNWDVGHIDPGTSKYIESDVYVPESLKGETLRVPMEITYFNAHGDQHTISRIVDFYIKGLIDASIFNIDVISLSGKPTVIGEIINEGNQDALFGFVYLDALGNSNIKSSSQYIDEIEIDSPVPFNIPIEFEGESRYGEHDIQIKVRYKDDIREEHFLIHDTTISIEPPSNDESGTSDMAQYIIIPVAIAIGIIAYRKIKKRKTVEI